MNQSKSLRFLTIVLMLCYSQVTIGQEYNFDIFNNEDEVNPLPKSAITSIFQDNNDIIWMANYGSGIGSYNGSELTIYDATHNLPKDVFGLHQDAFNRLWAYSYYSGLICSELPINEYDIDDTIRFVMSIDSVRLPKRKAMLSSTDILEDMNGRLLMSVDTLLYTINIDDKNQLNVDTLNLSKWIEGDHIYHHNLCQLSNGKIVIGNSIERLYLYDSNTQEIETKKIEVGGEPLKERDFITNLYAGPDDVLYGLARNGSFIIIEDVLSSPKYKVVPSLFQKNIKDVFFEKDLVLLSTTGFGILFYNTKTGKVEKTIGTAQGLPSNIIWKIIKDSDNNFWIATNNGIARIADDFLAFGHFTNTSVEGSVSVLPSLEVNNVIAKIELPNSDISHLAICTQKGLSIMTKDGKREFITIDKGLRNNSVLSCYQDQLGRIYALTSLGIDCIVPTKQLATRMRLDNVKSIEILGQKMYIGHTPINEMTIFAKSLELDNGLKANLFVGRYALYIYYQNTWYFLNASTGLPCKELNNCAIGKDNFLYLSDNGNGLLKSVNPFTEDELLSFPVFGKPLYANEISTEPVFRIQPVVFEGDTSRQSIYVEYFDDKLWYSSEDGLFVLDDRTFEPLKKISQKTKNSRSHPIGIIGIEGTSRIWASGTGLYEISTETLQIEREILPKDGLVSDVTWGLPGLNIDEDGVLYYATNKGLSIYNPTLDKKDTTAPTAMITKLNVVYPSKSNNEVDIAYTARSYAKESKVEYKTKLIGQDADWSEPNNKSNIRYTNLSALLFPKTYEFQVLAKDVHGNWQDQPTTIDFQIKPFWYLHWLACCGYLFLSFALARVYNIYRTRQLIKKQKQLEKTVEIRTAELRTEKDRSEELLLNILPAATAEELKKHGTAKAQNYEMVSVIFTDFKGFTSIAKSMTPADLIAEIDYCFRAFDQIMERNGVEKIKTIGDAYMAASGLPTTHKDHASKAVKAALEIKSFMLKYKADKKAKNEVAFEMRIGIHSGPVIAGVVGLKKFAYDIWGDTVNIASRLESNSLVDKVNISQSTYELLADNQDYTFEYRGKIEAKNRGELDMYFVESR